MRLVTPSTRAGRGCARLTEIIYVNVDRPLKADREVLRKTRDSCAKTHATEDDGARPDHR